MPRWSWLFVLSLTFRSAFQGSIVILEDRNDECSPCYRKLLSGKKVQEVHVRRAVDCERIEDCHRACELEKLFICEGFNYRRMGHGLRDICELTSLPYPRMDVHRDFAPDPQCDYYERDLNCIRDESRPSWWSSSPQRPPQVYGPPRNQYDLRPHGLDRGPANEIPRPIDFDRRPLDHGRPIEIPRPIEHDRRPPVIHGSFYGPSNDPFYRKDYPVERRPIEIPYPPERPYNGHDNFDRHQFGRPYPPIYSQRRLDHGSRDLGTNEVIPYHHEHRKNPNRDWGGYGGVYGGSYGYDTNYVGPFDVPKHHPRPPPQPKPPRPFESDHFYGQFYNYGGAFGYGDNYIPANEDHLYGGTKGSHECSVRAGAGFRLSRGVVGKTYLTPNLDQCESLCASEKNFLCMTFAYRYNVAATDPTDNCLLSEVTYKELNFYTDLEPDRNYDIYAMIGDAKVCGARKPPQDHPPDECFWRVRSGFGMPPDVVRKSMFVDGLGDCQAQCTISHDFTCRSFAFRYGLEHGRQDSSSNCFLSDWPSQEINPVNMPDMDGAELYERGSFGRGCEPFPLPPLDLGRFNEKPPRREEVCYSGYHRPCRLTPYSILLSIRVDSEPECRKKCSRMRDRDAIPCMSYSYKLSGAGSEENCLLSDVPIRDLRPGLDYIYDDHHVLYAWRDLDPRCTIQSYPVDEDRFLGSGYGAGIKPLRPEPPRPNDYGPPGHPDRPGILIGSNRPYEGLRPPETIIYDPDRPDPITTHWPSPGYDDKYGNGGYNYGLNLFYPNGLSTFQHYTVNGYPCKRGTKCERNKIADFWSCETEGSEYGSWDYCCAPSHNCGYSQGYNYPWCYVGSSEDQWRPCSERYYPYLPSPRPIRPPISRIDNRYPFERRDPDYLGRHWPVIYLHGQPPPNCTTDSVASADGSRDRKLNETTVQPETEKPTEVPSKDDESTSDKNDDKDEDENRMRRRRYRPRTSFNRAENYRESNERNFDINEALRKSVNSNETFFLRKVGSTFTAVSSRIPERLGKIEKIPKPRGNRGEFTNTISPATTTIRSDKSIDHTVRMNENPNKVIDSLGNASFITSSRKFVRVPLIFVDDARTEKRI